MGRTVLKLKSLALAGPAVGVLIGLGTLTMSANPASAATCAPYSANPCVTPVTSPVTTPPLGSKDGTPSSADGGSSLAFTGSDVALTSTIGAGAIAAGGMIVLASRRRRTQD